jgi:hypothetical protein
MVPRDGLPQANTYGQVRQTNGASSCRALQASLSHFPGAGADFRSSRRQRTRSRRNRTALPSASHLPCRCYRMVDLMSLDLVSNFQIKAIACPNGGLRGDIVPIAGQPPIEISYRFNLTVVRVHHLYLIVEVRLYDPVG